MHVEKNVCDSLIGTLLNIKGKTKDTKKSREDMVVMGIRQELAPKEIGNKTYFPQHVTLCLKKKKKVFANVCRVSKFPKGTHQM